MFTQEQASVICLMNEVCEAHNQGPDTAELMRQIFAEYPELNNPLDSLLRTLSYMKVGVAHDL